MINNDVVPNPAQNDSLTHDSVNLLIAAFPDINSAEPVTGKTEDIIIAPTLLELLARPEITTSHLTQGGKLLGISVAMPINLMDPDRAAESEETAYIYFSAIDPFHQGEGLIAKLMDGLHSRLQEQGYSFIERDCVIENGYADKVQRVYAGSIIESYDHTHFPEVGPERFFRIDLSKI